MSVEKVQGQPHNGEAKPTEPPVDLRSLLHPRRPNSQKGVFDEFLSSNKNNPTKSRIPHAAGMAVYQSLGLWGSTKTRFTYHVQGKRQQFPRNVAGLHELFKMLYDEDAISLRGKSREEGVTAALGYFLQDIESINSAQSIRLGEKGGASKSK
jgi:hypothetical protein